MIIGFIVLPLVLKPKIIEIISNETNAKIDIEKIYFNPFTFKLEISNLKLSTLEDKELLYFKLFGINFEPSSLINSAIHVKNLILKEPKISILLDKDKNINLTSIIKTPKTKKKEETQTQLKIPRIILNHIAIVDGSVSYEDNSKKSKFNLQVANINLELNGVDTKDINTSTAKFKFFTKLDDGGFIKLKSDIISYKPFIVKGSLETRASKLYTQWRYIRDSLNIEVADGKLSLYTNYYFNTGKLEKTTLSNFSIALEKLRLKPKAKHKDILTLNSLAINDATIKPLEQDIHIKNISLDSMHIKSKRDKQGNIDWQEYTKYTTKTDSKTKKPISEKTEQKNWKVLIDKINLEKIGFDFIDTNIRPNVTTTLNELNIYAQNVTLSGEKPFTYQMNMLLNTKLKCNSQGEIIHKVLELKSLTSCKNIDIAHYRPYIDSIASSELKIYDLKLRSLVAGFDANVTLKDIDSKIALNINDANIKLSKFSLNTKSTNKRVVNFSDFNIDGVKLNSLNKDINISKISLNNLALITSRDKNKILNIKDLVVPYNKNKRLKKNKKLKKAEKSYRVRLKKLAINSAKINFKDKAITPNVDAKIDKIYLNASNIDSKTKSWLKYKLFARINNSAKLKASGTLRHTPLKQKGKFSINKLSLKELTPYIQENAFLTLKDGYLSLNTNTSYAVSKEKPDLSIDGSLKLQEFFLNDTRDNSSLISFNNINLKKFTFELAPDRLFINEVDVDSFYINAMISKDKVFNFATLTKPNNKTPKSIDKNTTQKEPFAIRVMKVNVKNGNAKFSDESLPINFKTDIHNLKGVIYAISSIPNETSYINLAGEVDKYGSTKLKGSINSSNPKAYTNIDFNFRNLDLSAMSGYSSSFAGYKIKQGKLFLNLNYDILDSKLLSQNSIIIKKIKLGEELKTEDGTSLPLGFVIALLEDSDGIIDIDMPIVGNVDEPNFKYGTLVWKTFANLMLKAVTSPFRFLGSMMGIDGDKLEYAEFEAGSFNILPSEREKLDNVAKLLIKRPKISISIGGRYNKELDKLALQKIKLAADVVKISGAKNEKERVSAMTVELLEDLYKSKKDDKVLEQLKDKLDKKYDGEKFDREYLQALLKLCIKAEDISIKDIQNLASKRASILKSYLIDTKGISEARVKELEIAEISEHENNFVKSKLEVIVK
jgi:uncharacterized protein involved in outer membrane biogenesis